MAGIVGDSQTGVWRVFEMESLEEDKVLIEDGLVAFFEVACSTGQRMTVMMVVKDCRLTRMTFDFERCMNVRGFR